MYNKIYNYNVLKPGDIVQSVIKDKDGFDSVFVSSEDGFGH